MPEHRTIRLLDALLEHAEFHTAILMSYGIDPAFYEAAVLYPLRYRGCQNQLVLVDARRYQDTVTDLRESTKAVGRHYILLPVSLGPMQSFHPKLVLLLGRERGRLLVGSGNMTFAGFGHNYETYTCLDWTPREPELQSLFIEAWNLVRITLKRWGYSAAARTLLHKAEYVSDWLSRPAAPVADIRLLHTCDESLIEQCGRIIGDQHVERLMVLAPFLDDRASGLHQLYTRFHPSELRLVLQDKRAVGNLASLENLQRAGVPLQVHRFAHDDRYLHAKVYVWETDSASYLLTGSANCTHAAWSSTAAQGNVEAVLLRRSGRMDWPLLDGYIEPDGISSLSEIELRQEPITLSRQAASVRLLDVASQNQVLSVVSLVSQAPTDGVALELRLATLPAQFLALGEHVLGENRCQVPVPETLQLHRPLSASIWGLRADGAHVDLGCSELWITQMDALADVGHTGHSVHSGSYLADMALESEEEWRDLYNSLSQLIELDVAGLKRRGGTYTASPRGSRSPQAQTTEKETVVRLVDTASDDGGRHDEVANALYLESPFYAWLQYVHSRLPGALSEPPALKPEGQEPRPATDPEGKRSRRRWTPSERMGQAFLGLVKRYIATLQNVEYMQTVSVLHTLGYYPVFQRIAWLLLQHKVIDVNGLTQLIGGINRGFFGSPDKGPPVLCPRLQRYIQRAWRDEWIKAQVPWHALASMLLVEPPALEAGVVDVTREAWTPGGAADTETLRVLCGITAVMGIPWITDHEDDLVQWIEQVYGLDAKVAAYRLGLLMESHLAHIDAVMVDWKEQASAGASKTDDALLRQLVPAAVVDYFTARYDLLAHQDKIVEQTRVCSDLIFWARCAGQSGAVQTWSDMLVRLLESQEKGDEAAVAMFHQGRDLFFERAYEDAADQLRRSCMLAAHLGDEKLVAQCKQFLGHAEYFMEQALKLSVL